MAMTYAHKLKSYSHPHIHTLSSAVCAIEMLLRPSALRDAGDGETSLQDQRKRLALSRALLSLPQASGRGPCGATSPGRGRPGDNGASPPLPCSCLHPKLRDVVPKWSICQQRAAASPGSHPGTPLLFTPPSARSAAPLRTHPGSR